jgi:hypothetical protein
MIHILDIEGCGLMIILMGIHLHLLNKKPYKMEETKWKLLDREF